MDISSDYSYFSLEIDSFIQGSFRKVKDSYNYYNSTLRISYLSLRIFQNFEGYKNLFPGLKEGLRLPSIMSFGFSLKSLLDSMVNIKETAADRDWYSFKEVNAKIFYTLTDLLADFNAFSSSFNYFTKAKKLQFLGPLILSMSLISSILMYISQIKQILYIRFFSQSESAVTLYNTLEKTQLMKQSEKLVQRHLTFTEKEKEEITSTTTIDKAPEKFEALNRGKKRKTERLIGTIGQEQLELLKNTLKSPIYVSSTKVRKILSNLYKVTQYEYHDKIFRVGMNTLTLIALVFTFFNVYTIAIYGIFLATTLLKILKNRHKRSFTQKISSSI